MAYRNDDPHILLVLKCFDYLSEWDFTVQETSVDERPLVGRVVIVQWVHERADRTIKVLLALGSTARPPTLSVLVCSSSGSFTYTDWIHFNREDWAVNAVDLSTYPDVSPGVAGAAAAFRRSAAGILDSVLSGQSWIEVPTYLGVNA